MDYDKNLYWRDWDDLHHILKNAKIAVDQRLEKINKKKDKKARNLKRQLASIVEYVKKLGEPGWIVETKEQTQFELLNCPWKDHKHIRCLSCECRRSETSAYRARDPHCHSSMSKLRPAAECDTGR